MLQPTLMTIFCLVFLVLQNVESSYWWRKLAIIMQCGDILIIINNPSINTTTTTTIRLQQHEMMHHNYHRQSIQRKTPLVPETRQQRIIRRPDKGWVESWNLIYIHFTFYVLHWAKEEPLFYISLNLLLW